MAKHNPQNIIVSSWPSSGGTTMALLIANLLQMQYVYGGGVLKTFAKEMYGAESGKPHIQFEQEYGIPWDGIWEAYAKWASETKSHILLEGMTAGFFYNNDNTFAIMFKASLESRAQRSDRDSRLDSLETLKIRDVEVRERWIRDLGVDVYDEDLIKEKYDLMLDTSGMTITESLLSVQEHLQESGFDVNISMAEAAALEQKYWDKGKDFFKEKLRAKGLLLDAGNVFTEWKEHFPKMVSELPEDMRVVVNRLAG